MTSEARKKAAIYVRVSTQDQNLDNQILPLVEYCKRQNWDYEVFQEKESTRKTRPVQWNLFQNLTGRTPDFDILLFYKFDRWARSSKEIIDHIERLLAKNITIISYTENIDLSNSMGRAMFTIISAFAQLERDIISERTKAGLARARARGKTLGRPKGARKGNEAPIEKVGELLGKSYTVREIAKELHVTRYRVEQAIEKIKALKTGGVFDNNVLV